MIPTYSNGSLNNQFTPNPIVSDFIPPYNEPYKPFSQNILGGIALGDGSKGRQFKQWNISYDGTSIRLKPLDGDVVWTYTVSDIRDVSCSFDNNMSQVVAFTKDDGCYLYYRDTLTQQFITRQFLGATKCRVCVDDARDFYNPESDVMFFYTLNNKLYYRQQRDRYDIQVWVADTKKELRRVGPNKGLRLQVELI